MKLKNLFALILTISMLLSCMAFALPVAAEMEAIKSEVIGASIRTAGTQGLRFVGKIEKNEALHSGEGANFGFLLLPKSAATSTTQIDELNGPPVVVADDITTETTSIRKVPAVKLLSEADVATVVLDYADDYEDYYYFSAVITGIPAEFYGTDIIARIYMTIEEENHYSSQKERSVQYVANTINEMGGEVPAFITEVLQTFEEVGHDILVNADLFWAGIGEPTEPVDPGDDPGENPVDPGEDPGEDPGIGDNPVDPGEITSSFGAYKYVAFIGVDGGGRFFQNVSTPNIDSIFANGAITYNCLTPVSISAESWGSMLHGVGRDYHRLTNSSVKTNRYPTDSAYPSVFRVIREADSNASLASIVGWEAINYGIVEEGLGVYKADSDVDTNDATDWHTRDLVCNYLNTQIPTLLFVQFNDTDNVGHNSGWGSSQYYNTISLVDGYIRDIFAKYEEAGVLDETLFLLTADHGGSGYGHGGNTDDHCRVLFAARGKTVAKGTVGDIENRDISAIVTYALGLKNPSTWTARVPSGLFTDVEAQERPAPEVANDGSRQHTNVDTPEDALAWVENNISQSLYLYLPLDDGDYSDATGNKTVTSGGKLYCPEGYYGDALVFDDGYLKVSNYYPGTGNSFSISFWINTFGTVGDPLLFSNKNWSSGANAGWLFCLNSDRMSFNIGDGSNRRDIWFTLPSNYFDGWMHVVLVVNPSANSVKVYYDFAEQSPSRNSGSSITNMNFTNGSNLYIGQDITGKYKYSLPAYLDDIMIFNGALTASDVAALQTYYGK